ncbi:MAG TPA: hypothetical protein VIY54_05590 [Steroidobacteraceae bacterium]
MLSTNSIGCALLLLLLMSPGARATDAAREDLSLCPGSDPQPAHSAMWKVAFCNRTAHDLVVQFRDNDCPVQQGAHRGDVYERTLPRGQASAIPLCYADESHQTLSPQPGVPTLRIPGGKGVITTWNVVGDCGEQSAPLNLDARTFYDRGDYPTGILLLQFPSGASHCVADRSAAAANPGAPVLRQPAVPRTSSPAAGAAGAATNPSASPASAVAAVASAPSESTGSLQPALRVQLDTQDPLRRTVRVFATNAPGQPGYECRIRLALTFADGGTFNERIRAQIASDAHDVLIATKKYFKSVSAVELEPSGCAAH